MTPTELRWLRQRIRRTQSSLAKRLGVSLRTVQLWEAGERPIPAATGELLEIVAGIRQPVIEPVDDGPADAA